MQWVGWKLKLYALSGELGKNREAKGQGMGTMPIPQIYNEWVWVFNWEIKPV